MLPNLFGEEERYFKHFDPYLKPLQEQYAIRERFSDPTIKIFNDFKETVSIRPDFMTEGIHGKYF